MLAPSDAAAQLMQLRQAEALGVLDDHHRRIRHVDADLHDRGRDENLELAGGKRLPSRAPCASAFIRPCSRPTRYCGNTSCARWSAISVAALRSTFADSSTSG